MVRLSLKETLNALLEAEADQIYGAERCQRSAERVDTLGGSSRRSRSRKPWSLPPHRSVAQPSDCVPFPYMYLDGVVLERSWAGEVRNVSVLVAIGIGSDGFGKS